MPGMDAPKLASEGQGQGQGQGPVYVSTAPPKRGDSLLKEKREGE